MNKRIISDIVNIVQLSVNKSSTCNNEKDPFTEIDPKVLFTIRTKRIALCMGILTSLKFRDNRQISLDGIDLIKHIRIFKEKAPWNTLLLNYYFELDISEKELFNRWYQDIYPLGFKEISLSMIYETLLSYEWVLDETGFHVKSDKSSRNRSGSYYTPEYLAEISIRKVIDQKLEEKLGISQFSFNPMDYKEQFINIVALLTSFKIIDFSCGTGHFLLAFINYVTKYLSPLQLECKKSSYPKESLISSFISNIWGVDIDFIALEIAKNELISLTDDCELHEKISAHFIHGNPLIPASFNTVTSEEKRKLTSAGFLYHTDLGLHWGEYEDEIKDGFELVVGNPPWEKIRFEEKSFFRPWAPHISKLNKKDDRAKEIEELKMLQPRIYKYYKEFVSQLEATKKLIKGNSLFTHSAVGELNTYALFTELASSFIGPEGRVCYIVKSAIVVSPVNESLFKFLLSHKLIISCYDFINRKNIFAIDNRERFCVLILGYNHNTYFHFKSGLTTPDELLVNDDLHISKDILNLLNPLTGMLPSVTDPAELSFLIRMHSLHPVLEKEFPDCKYGRLVHFTNHADFIDREPKDDNIPIYEGKFIELYDGRYSTYEGVNYNERYGNKASSILIPENKKENPSILPISRYFIKEGKWESLNKHYKEKYSLVWRSLTSASNRRTTIATILPHLPASQSVQFLQLSCTKSLTILLSLFNSVVFDYMVRLKLNGIDLTQKILKQIAVPSLHRFEEKLEYKGVGATIFDHIAYRVAILLCNDVRMIEFANDIKPIKYPANHLYYATPKELIAEIDQLIAITYDIDESTFEKILSSFPSFYSEQEISQYFGNKKQVAPLQL